MRAPSNLGLARSWGEAGPSPWSRCWPVEEALGEETPREEVGGVGGLKDQSVDSNVDFFLFFYEIDIEHSDRFVL